MYEKIKTSAIFVRRKLQLFYYMWELLLFGMSTWISL